MVQPSTQPRRNSIWLNRPGRIVLLATLIAGAPFLFFGAIQFVRSATWVSQRVEAPGVVRETVLDAKTKRYYVVVDYTSLSGDEIAFGRWSDGPGAYQDGETVRVMYREESPELSARIVTWRSLWFEAFTLTLLGILPIVIGLIVFVVTERRIAAAPRSAAPPPTPGYPGAGT